MGIVAMIASIPGIEMTQITKRGRLRAALKIDGPKTGARASDTGRRKLVLFHLRRSAVGAVRA